MAGDLQHGAFLFFCNRDTTKATKKGHRSLTAPATNASGRPTAWCFFVHTHVFYIASACVHLEGLPDSLIRRATSKRSTVCCVQCCCDALCSGCFPVTVARALLHVAAGRLAGGMQHARWPYAASTSLARIRTLGSCSHTHAHMHTCLSCRMWPLALCWLVFL